MLTQHAPPINFRPSGQPRPLVPGQQTERPALARQHPPVAPTQVSAGGDLKCDQTKIQIDPEFLALIPALTANELAQFEANIVADGWR